MTYQMQINRLADMIADSDSIVFFGGAGVSTESGIPDFRSKASQEKTFAEMGRSAEEVLSADFFYSSPHDFYRYIRSSMSHADALPNDAHRVLAKWEESGRISAIITQNIDSLHQKGGSKKVWELHGTLSDYRCVDCGKHFTEEDALGGPVDELPTCDCGGLLKPEVVLYGESLPEDAINGAAVAVSDADMLIVAGTSLVVYPAAALVTLFRGKYLVVVNLSPTSADNGADLVISAPIGKVLLDVEAKLNPATNLG